MKDESLKTVFVETSTTGLFGTWTRQGGSSAIIQSGVEGPAAYWDNVTPGKVHLLLDFYGADGYRPFEKTASAENGGDLLSGLGGNTGWTASARTGWPGGLRHGSVLPVGKEVYERLGSKWGS